MRSGCRCARATGSPRAARWCSIRLIGRSWGASASRSAAARRESPVTAGPVADELRKAVKRVNKQLAPFEQIRKYRILDRELSIEHGELTATMKVRRARALENFREHIEQLYAGKEENL